MSSSAQEIASPDSPPIHDLRSSPRRVLTSPLTASFGSAAVQLVDVSGCGFMGTHFDWLKVGKSAMTVIAPPSEQVHTAMPARIVWSRLVKSDGGRISYRSGFAISTDYHETAHELVRDLVSHAMVSNVESALVGKIVREKKPQPPVQSQPVEASAPMTGTESLSLARRAYLYLRAHPQIFEQWRRKARASREPFAPDVVAVWEFLGRQVELPLVRLACDLG